MVKIVACLLLIFLNVFITHSQAHLGDLHGNVSSKGQPIIYANIYLEGTSYGTISDENGNFTLKNIPFSVYKIQVSFTGYEKFRKEINVNAPKLKTLYIDLSPSNTIIEEVVITGQYEPTEIKKSVYKVKVLGGKIIQERGAVNLRDVLGQEMSIRIIHDNILGSNIILQGLSGQNVKILQDGIPLISGKSNSFDLNQINLNNVKQVEIIEGPLSVQYGTNALAGTVNLISKELPKGKMVAAGLNTYYESIGQYNADAFIGTHIKKSKIRAAFGRNQFTGFSSLEDKRTMNWNPKTQYFGNLRYTQKIKDLNLGISYNHFKQMAIGYGVPTITPTYAIATDRYNYTTRWDTNVFFNGKLNDENYIDFVGGHQKYYQKGIKYLVNLQDNTKKKTSDPSDHDSTFFNSYISRGAYSKKGIARDKIATQLGYDLNWNSSEGGRINKDGTTIFDGGLFGSINYKPIDELEIQPGFRYVFSNQFSTKSIHFLGARLPIIPSLNVKYTWKENTRIRASYAKGFRTPSIRELYYYFHDANHSIDGNPNLIPETSNNITLSIQHTVLKDNWLFRIESSAYYNNMKDRIYLIRKGSISLGDENKVNRTYLNLPFFKTQGVNLGFTYKSNNDLSIKAGAGLLVRSGSKSLGENFYSQELNSSVSYLFPKTQTKISCFYKYNGPLAEFSLIEDEVVNRTLQGYNMLDVSASRNFNEGLLGLSCGVKNIFNVIDIVQTGNGTDGLLPRTGFKQKVPISWGTTFFINLKINFNK